MKGVILGDSPYRNKEQGAVVPLSNILTYSYLSTAKQGVFTNLASIQVSWAFLYYPRFAAVRLT